LACLGTSQHLKSKFSVGYELTISCSVNTEKEVLEFVEKQFQVKKKTT